jgi:hypothetical protein
LGRINNKIVASTPYDFQARNLTAYGGLLPVAAMLEKIGFQQLVEQPLTVKRRTRSMPMYGFILGMVMACYVGFSRLNHQRFLKLEPMLTGILRVAELPPQSTFWRFLASLHLGIVRQLLTVQWRMRERVWAAANVQLNSVTVDTDTTVHTLFGNQMGRRKSYNPKNKGKKSYQPILSFIAETREYAAGALRSGDRPDGREIAEHLENVAMGLPATVKIVYARADSGFYCCQAIEAYEKKKWRYIVVARKTARLVEQLQSAKWKRSPLTDADGQCEFLYQFEGWGKACRFLALRYEKLWHCWHPRYAGGDKARSRIKLKLIWRLRAQQWPKLAWCDLVDWPWKSASRYCLRNGHGSASMFLRSRSYWLCSA